jgi:hypothetical protein
LTSERPGTVVSPARAQPGVRRIARRAAVWAAFVGVHLWVTVVGLALRPESAYDVELYRRWVEAGIRDGLWPVLDLAWVYPMGALAPMTAIAPAAASPMGYAAAWFAMVTALDAVGVAVLLGAGRHGRVGAWWWIAALAALGPVALGRLDGVVVPITVVALVWATRRPRVATALLTLGAWIKVAPGAIVLAVAATARRPWRTVMLPASVLSLAVAGLALAGGAGGRVVSFLGAQGARGLQIESVAATPYSLARWWEPGLWAELDVELNAYQVGGADTGMVRVALDVVLVATVAIIGWLAWRASHGPALPDGAAPGGAPTIDRGTVLLAAALALQLALIVANKVGSPQFIAWLFAPVAVALSRHGWAPPWRLPAVLVLVVAGLTQWVFPLDYDAFLWARGPVVLAAAVRNVALVVLLVLAVVRLARLGGRRGAAATVTR